MKLAWSARNRSLTLLDALGLAGVCGFLVARFIPVARLPFWHCVIRERTGIPCPGCGLTRVADRLSHLNVRGAWEANPLGTLAALGFAACAVFMLAHWSLKTPVPEVRVSAREARALRIGLVCAFVANYAWVVGKTVYLAHAG